MLRERDPASREPAQRRLECPFRERLRDPPSESQDAREIELAASGNVERPGSRMVDRVEEDLKGVTLRDQLEAGIEAEQRRTPGRVK